MITNISVNEKCPYKCPQCEVSDLHISGNRIMCVHNKSIDFEELRKKNALQEAVNICFWLTERDFALIPIIINDVKSKCKEKNFWKYVQNIEHGPNGKSCIEICFHMDNMELSYQKLLEIVKIIKITIDRTIQKTNPESTCPNCGGHNILYGSYKFNDESVCYPCVCESCGTGFNEYYTIEYYTAEIVDC